MVFGIRLVAVEVEAGMTRPSLTGLGGYFEPCSLVLLGVEAEDKVETKLK